MDKRREDIINEYAKLRVKDIQSDYRTVLRDKLLYELNEIESNRGIALSHKILSEEEHG
jgi:hypothetical protein